MAINFSKETEDEIIKKMLSTPIGDLRMNLFADGTVSTIAMEPDKEEKPFFLDWSNPSGMEVYTGPDEIFEKEREIFVPPTNLEQQSGNILFRLFSPPPKGSIEILIEQYALCFDRKFGQGLFKREVGDWKADLPDTRKIRFRCNFGMQVVSNPYHSIRLNLGDIS